MSEAAHPVPEVRAAAHPVVVVPVAVHRVVAALVAVRPVVAVPVAVHRVVAALVAVRPVVAVPVAVHRAVAALAAVHPVVVVPVAVHRAVAALAAARPAVAAHAEAAAAPVVVEARVEADAEDKDGHVLKRGRLDLGVNGQVTDSVLLCPLLLCFGRGIFALITAPPHPADACRSNISDKELTVCLAFIVQWQMPLNAIDPILPRYY